MNQQEPTGTNRKVSELLYKKSQLFKALSFFIKSFSLSDSNAKKQAILNRLKDYFFIKKQLSLHYEIAKILEEQGENYDSYDYGEGYFYQSCKPLHITGFRNTEARIAGMKLREHLKGKTVLDIGTNAGFLPLEVSDVCKSIDAFDINPYLIRIAKASAEFLNIHNVNFWAGVFEDFNEDKTYDVVLSFANHSTYDHNTKQSVEDYFKKCHKYVKDGGVLLFESHHPSYETPERLEKVLAILKRYFDVERICKLTRGSSGDRGRTFAICSKKV